MSRKYIKIDEYGKQILEMKAQGKTSRESHLPPLSSESLPGEYADFVSPSPARPALAGGGPGSAGTRPVCVRLAECVQPQNECGHPQPARVL